MNGWEAQVWIVRDTLYETSLSLCFSCRSSGSSAAPQKSQRISIKLRAFFKGRKQLNNTFISNLIYHHPHFTFSLTKHCETSYPAYIRNSAYKWPWISWHVRIVALIQKTRKIARKMQTKIPCHVYYVRYQMSHVTFHMSRVICHLSPVPYHLSPVTNANSHSHRPSPC